MSWWAWLIVSTLGPLPLVWLYRRWQGWRQARREAQEVRDFMAERRQRFGGAIREPGRKDVTPLDRP